MKKIIVKLLTKFIYNSYAMDMGNWFDHIKDHEEEIYSEIEGILLHGTRAEKIQLLKGGF